MRNSTEYGSGLLESFSSRLAHTGSEGTPVRLPKAANDSPFDAAFSWDLPGGSLLLEVEIKQQTITSRDDVRRITRIRGAHTPVLLATFLSPAARDELRQAGWSYWDQTGNMLVQNREPFVWIEREGASRNPWPNPTDAPRGLRSLKGRAASVVIVKLLTERRAASVRELSRETGVGVATVSRVADLLRGDELLEDTGTGPLIVTDTQRLAARWAQDYSFTTTFKARRYFSLLGEEIALDRLRTGDSLYALTGVKAANHYLGTLNRAASLPTNETWIYTPDRDAIERELHLSPDTRGSIVIGEWGFLEQEGFRTIDRLNYARPWRTVGDLLSTPGRTASVGEDLAAILDEERA